MEGDDFDIVSYEDSTEAVSVNLATGVHSGGDAQGDRISNVEGVVGSAYDDVIVGDDGDNNFVGGDGDDVIDGGKGLMLLMEREEWILLAMSGQVKGL